MKRRTAASSAEHAEGAKEEEVAKPRLSSVSRGEDELSQASDPTKSSQDGGIVSNGSISEEELETFFAPEDVAQEEERLRSEREAKAENQEVAPLEEELSLSDLRKNEHLDELLNRTNMYTQFLNERMVGDELDVRAPEPAVKAAVGGKRKAGKKVAVSSKKQKPLSPTAAFLPQIKGELRDYQLKGVKWIVSLYQNGLNGILADQMGLGKTVQTIGFLTHLRDMGVNGPFLVLGPLSTLPNWVAEFERWAPTVPCILYHGNRDERQRLRTTKMPVSPRQVYSATFPVVVTSYEIVMADSKFLQKYQWKYIIVDEGHRLKNFNCKLVRELNQIPTANKLLLTGTPLQNNLSELWALLNFLLPEIFNDMSQFEGWFDFAEELAKKGVKSDNYVSEQKRLVVSKLHHVLKPFLLRRIKTDVETSLPAKVEMILWAGMTETQRKFNDQLRDKTLPELMKKLSKSSGGAGSAGAGKLNNVVMQMRKNCNHPDLISGGFDGSVEYPPPEELIAQGGKFALMDRLLMKLLAGGHKVLIFSQMTKMLDLIACYLDTLGHKTCRIDGSISWQERQESMRLFNTDPDHKVFLLSTRAGGLGINLTSADSVIIYDSDWNPHQDMQAMDRAHRIGQVKPVLVFRLATAHSVEGKLLRRANTKLMLERLVIKKGAFLGDPEAGENLSLGVEELFELLKDDNGDGDADQPQSGIVDDKMLESLLDRKHLEVGKKAPYPLSGPGYEIVAQLEGSGLLSGVN